MKRILFFLALAGLGYAYSLGKGESRANGPNVVFAELEDDPCTMDLALARRILTVAATKLNSTPEVLFAAYLAGRCTIDAHETIPQAYRVNLRDGGGYAVIVLGSNL